MPGTLEPSLHEAPRTYCTSNPWTKALPRWRGLPVGSGGGMLSLASLSLASGPIPPLSGVGRGAASGTCHTEECLYCYLRRGAEASTLRGVSAISLPLPLLSMTIEKNLSLCSSPESNRVCNLSNYAEETAERKGSSLILLCGN